MKLEGELEYEIPARDLENNNRPQKELRFTICNCFQISDECLCQPPKRTTLQPATLKSCFLVRSQSEQIIRDRILAERRAESLSNINTAKYIRQSVIHSPNRKVYVAPSRTRFKKSKFLRKIPFLGPHKVTHNRQKPSKRKVHPKPSPVKKVPTLENIVEETRNEEQHDENTKTEERKQ